jgi:photosystem II stability/assembly factor-like uncharacterized protein
MKDRVVTLVVTVLLVSGIAVGQTRWSRVPTPGPSPLTCLRQTGNVILAGTLGGVYRSLDSGRTWSESEFGFANVLDLAADSFGLCAAATKFGVVVSTDRGVHWSRSTLSVRTYAVAIDDHGTIYAGSGGWEELPTVHTSTDHGATWSRNVVDWDEPDSRVCELLVDDSGVVIAGYEPLWVTGQNRLYRSTDRGRSWGVGRHSGGDPWTSYERGLARGIGGRLYAGSENGGLFQSTDLGRTWLQIDIPQNPGKVTAIAAAADGSVFACSDVIHFFPDTSLTNPVALDSIGFTSLLLLSPGIALGGNEQGAYRSTNAGRGWLPAMDGLAAQVASWLIVDADDRLWFDGNVSTDHGRSWRMLVHPDSVDDMFADADGFLYAYRRNRGRAQLRRSTDGLAWELLPSQRVFDNIWGMKRFGEWLLCHGQYGMVGSSDHGASWESLYGSAVYDVTADADGVLYITNSYSGVLRSDDHGASWTTVSTGLPRVPEGYVLAYALGIDADGTLYCSIPGNQGNFMLEEFGLYRSRDQGASWQQVLADSANILEILTINPGTLLLKTYGHGVLIGRDGGDRWEAINDGLTNPQLHALCIDRAGFLYAGSYGSGIFRTDASVIPCTRTVSLRGVTGLKGGYGDIIHVPLRIDPALDGHDDLSLSCTIVFDPERLSFDGVQPRGSDLLQPKVELIGPGRVHLLLDGVPRVMTDTLVALRFAVREVPEAEHETIISIDSLELETQCMTTALSEDIGIQLRRPDRWQLVAWPNPASGVLTLRIEAPASDDVRIDLVDLLGRTLAMMHAGPLAQGSHERKIDLTQYPSGHYWLHLRTSGINLTRRIMLQH